MQTDSSLTEPSLEERFDWPQLARLILVSRAIDAVEENRLAPAREVLYQFSSRGHELAQVVLGSCLTGERDGISAYYRSRPLLLSLGVSIEDAVAGPMARSGGYSDGRDIGVVSNLPSKKGPVVLPMAGDVGSQFTPGMGWAQAINYRSTVLQDDSWSDSIAVVMGGDGSVATNGFWSALSMATTLQLRVLFFIEDNGYGISVPSSFQTPGGNIAANLRSFQNLQVWEGDGTDPLDAAVKISSAVDFIRAGQGPALLRLTVPRLSGHSGQDTQTYKTPLQIEEEKSRDPLEKLRQFLVDGVLSRKEWTALQTAAEKEVESAVEAALQRAQPDPEHTPVTRYVFSEEGPDGPEIQQLGGVAADGHRFPSSSTTPQPEATRTNMLTAIRRTLEHELETNPKVLIFGEDVGPKGGVHAATMGLQEKFGEARVFDTSLSEEGIIGRAVGMALAGLVPVAEIQFRKYADPAMEQLNNCGTIRWRTANRFAAPIVVRMPGGFFKCGDPWHSVCDEVVFAHARGWRIAFPSNAEDAVGLLRAALRGNDPTIFFEHRACLDGVWARRPYPGNDYVLEFGQARIVLPGSGLTVVTWGAMVEQCLQAAHHFEELVEVIDLRTLMPWDRRTVLASLGKTKRCLIVHEDVLTAGFGAEISARLVEDAFFDLDAPIRRLAVPDVPIPYNVGLMHSILPDTSQIAEAIRELIEF